MYRVIFHPQMVSVCEKVNFAAPRIIRQCRLFEEPLPGPSTASTSPTYLPRPSKSRAVLGAVTCLEIIIVEPDTQMGRQADRDSWISWRDGERGREREKRPKIEDGGKYRWGPTSTNSTSCGPLVNKPSWRISSQTPVNLQRKTRPDSNERREHRHYGLRFVDNARDTFIQIWSHCRVQPLPGAV